MRSAIDGRELLDVTWRRIALPLLGLCAGLAAAQLATPLLPVRYEAQASVLVVADTPSGDRPAELGVVLAQNLAPTVAKLISSREVALAAARELGLAEHVVAGHVHGEFEPGLQIVLVRADATSAADAAAIADAVSRVTGGQLERLRLGGDAGVTTRVVDTAGVPSQPASPKPLLNSALGALVGLLVGWGATVLRDRFDRRLRDTRQLESRLGLPVVGSLPQLPRPSARHHARALFGRREVAVSARATICAVDVLTTSARPRLLVLGAHDDDGAAAVSALLGLALATERRRVAVVDAAVRDPALAGLFPGTLFTWQQIRAGFHRPARIAGLPDLTVLPTEPQQSLTTGQARDLGELLDVLAESADCVIVHGSPVLACYDTAALAEHADAVLLVVAAGRTDPNQAARAARLLRRLDLPLVGTIAVGAIDRPAERDTDTAVAAVFDPPPPPDRAPNSRSAPRPLPASAVGFPSRGGATVPVEVVAGRWSGHDRGDHRSPASRNETSGRVYRSGTGPLPDAPVPERDPADMPVAT
ncbi:hypothetical protein HCA58_09120 [Micromonospora sp. HNM0581]|uniref:hypothetical protein n=1 Tax=Micromonospora sp. HNM0581 TaxID=2716341 RepID=UPI001469B854|nr:hypothetical protein [Micromonospora sp. HNM0581]NLU78537.1 hypothetical protein [Micromonospora sp. HNM0581]